MAAVGHIARARASTTPETIVPLPAFEPYPNSTARRRRDARFASRRTRTSRFRPTACIARDHAADADHLPEQSEQSDGPADPDRAICAASPRPRRTRSSSSTRRTSTSAATTFLPELPQLSERARRAHVLEGVRPRRHARRRRDRPAASRSTPSARSRCPSTSTRVAMAATLRGARGPRVPAAVRRAGRASRASGSMRRADALGLELLEERGELRAGPGRRHGRARRRGARRARRPRARSLEGSGDAGCIRITAGHGRPHRRGHRGAGIGHVAGRHAR